MTADDRRGAEQLARLLAVSFPCYEEDPAREAQELLSPDRMALAAWDGERLVGFIGAIPQYHVQRREGRIYATGWELHPLAVFPEDQGRGVGAALVKALEHALDRRGASLLYLGCDDERGQTSLADTDLYTDTFRKIENITNFDRHPYSFYEKQGFCIVGVFPDANGPGRPDIWMAKSIGKKEEESVK